MSYRSNWGRTHGDMDPGDCTDAQLELDMPTQRACKCGATHPAQCPVDTALRWAMQPGRRHKTCLRRVDPATSEWPAGY